MQHRSAEAFAHTLLHELEQGTKFAFFLGAGCSFSSGIKTAAGLVREWLPKLCRTQTGTETGWEAFAKDTFPGFDPKNPSGVYGPVIEALFNTPRKRQQEIDRQTGGKDPGFGYAALAHLLTHETWGRQCNVVLTTNFDDLVADSLYLYTRRRPLVIAHEALAGFVRLTDEKPVVVKLHGDSLLTPANTAKETSDLKPEVQQVFRDLVRERGLIFMGYGGNDRSILNALKALGSDGLHGGVLWINDHIPENEFGEWLRERGAVWVKHLDFDEVMVHLRAVMALSDPDESWFRRPLDSYHRSLRDIAERIGKFAAAPNATPEAQALRKAVETPPRQNRSVADYALQAAAVWKSNLGKAISILEDGLVDHPESSMLASDLATYLFMAKCDPDRTEQLYERAIVADPNDTITLGNFANFLNEIRKDHDRAEQLYERAIAIDPNSAITLGNFANFLCNIRKDHDRAEQLYERAIAIRPDAAIPLSNFATFLSDIRKDHDRAEQLYERVIAAHPQNAPRLCNFASFLTSIRKDHDRAEQLYERASAADPNHPGYLGNYARCKFWRGARQDGMDLVDRAFALEPQHPSLELELWFYRLAHDARYREVALAEMKARLARGDRSPGWDLSGNVAQARREEHPFPDLLAAIAAVIADEAPLESLDGFDLWETAALPEPV